MSLTELGALGEFIGSIAVLITLIYFSVLLFYLICCDQFQLIVH